jgi:hypothetical protein
MAHSSTASADSGLRPLSTLFASHSTFAHSHSLPSPYASSITSSFSRNSLQVNTYKNMRKLLKTPNFKPCRIRSYARFFRKSFRMRSYVIKGGVAPPHRCATNSFSSTYSLQVYLLRWGEARRSGQFLRAPRGGLQRSFNSQDCSHARIFPVVCGNAGRE